MDDCITRAEHEEFARRFEAEEKRQNHYPYLLKFEGEKEIYGTSL